MTADANILYRGDCKTALDELYKEGVRADLIYLDPPFNSSRIYSMIFNHSGIDAQQVAFHDMWDFGEKTAQLYLNFKTELDQADLPFDFKKFMAAWMEILKEGSPEDRKLLNYLMYMTERLVRMKKILKPTGSIYFHCDPTASHYIKVVMDGILGRKNFLNDVIWSYRTGGVSKKWYGRKHDNLLFYAKSGKHFFNVLREKSYNRDYKAYKFKNVEEFQDEYGRWYTMASLRDVWEINAIGRTASERRGYPTQKPIKLLDRIIKASCPPGGIVIDPFCGCGTTVEAAHHNNCSWVGIDISGYAIEEIKARMAENGVTEDEYLIREGNPETMKEYDRMKALEKQDWLVRRIGGQPNPRKSGDGGIDGEMTIHLGKTEGQHRFGRMIFSVKTGKQHKPEHVRELAGTMRKANAEMGGLILDADPTPNMEITADSYGHFMYRYSDDVPEQPYSRVQILTAQEIIDGQCFNAPPTMQAIKLHLEQQERGQRLFSLSSS